MNNDKEKTYPLQEGKEVKGENVPLSETIQDAHAAGDGSLGRGKDTVMNVDDEDEAVQEKTETTEDY